MILDSDAFHDCDDPGAIDPSGTYENNVTLAVARQLHQLIENEPGITSLLIRTGDYYIPLEERFARAREAGADLFVSVHADAFRDRDRKSTRLNSSHVAISYAVFCLKKQNH